MIKPVARNHHRRLAGMLVLCMLVGGFSAWGGGTKRTWTGSAGGANYNWNTATNWFENLVPTTGNDIIFPSGVSGAALNPVNDMSSLSVHSISFTGSGYTVSGNALTVTAGVTNSSGGLNAFNPNMTLSGAQTFSANGNLTFGGTIVTPTGLLTVDVVTLRTMEFQNVVSGNGGITKIDAGTLKMYGNVNTYKGKTLVSGGILFIDRETSLGGNPSSFTADQLKLDGGTLEANNNFNLGDGNSHVGVTLGAGGGTIITDPGVTVIAYSSITGSGSLTKTGTGTLDLYAAQSSYGPTLNNTYTGKTIIDDGGIPGNGGILGIDEQDELGPNPSSLTPDQITINGGTLFANLSFAINYANLGVTLGADGGNISVRVGKTLTVNKIITGSGSLKKIGSGTLKLATAVNTYTGKTIVSAGTLQIDDENRLGSNPSSFAADQLTIDDGATLEAFGNVVIDDSNRGVSLDSGNPNIYVDSSFTLEVDKPISGGGALNSTGPGKLKLTTANSYTGLTSVGGGGTLAINATDCLGADPGYFVGSQLTINSDGNGGTLEASGSFTLGADYGITLGGATPISGGTISVDSGNTFEVDTAIDDGGNGYGLTVTSSGAGILDLTAPNTYTGPTTVSSGKLLINGSTDSASAATVASGATLGGSGTVNGTVDDSGILSPGNSPGTLNTGAETWESGGSYQFEITNAIGGAGTGWDLLNISGALSVAATSGSTFTIQVVSLNGSSAGSCANFDNKKNYSWLIATASSGVTGFDPSAFTIDASQFANSTGAVGAFSISQSGNNVYLNFTPVFANPAPYGRAWGTFQRIPVSNLLTNYTTGNDTRTLVSVAAGSHGTPPVISSGLILLATSNNLSETFQYVVQISNYATSLATNTITLSVTNAVGTGSISTSGGSVAIRFFGVPTFNYIVQRASSVNGPWSDVSGSGQAAPTSGTWTWTDPSPPGSAAYYRLRQNN